MLDLSVGARRCRNVGVSQILRRRDQLRIRLAGTGDMVREHVPERMRAERLQAGGLNGALTILRTGLVVVQVRGLKPFVLRA